MTSIVKCVVTPIEESRGCHWDTGEGVAWKQSVIVMSRAENFDFCLFVNFGPLLQLILYVFGI